MTLHALPAQVPPSDEPPDGDWEYSLRLPHGPRAAGIARSTVRLVLHEYKLLSVLDDAELLCSELVTNAFRHAHGGDIFVLLRRLGESVRLSVRDTTCLPPVPRSAAPDDTDGRGLLLVRRLAARWGVYDFSRQGGGKAVWVDLAL